MKIGPVGAAVLLPAAILFAGRTTAAATCESLSSLDLPHTTITLAQTVAAGAFIRPGTAAGAKVPVVFQVAPAFCRVAATISPVPDSEIRMEVWIPASGWNGKVQGVGNGGFAGSIEYTLLAAGIINGYAMASTDTGHQADGVDATWALGHPEKIADFGWRGIHAMTVIAKMVVTAWSGTPPSHSYFAGCSDGGREALMEAQRFPEDYDGILAGAPANYWSHLLSLAIADVQVLQADPASYIPPGKVPAIADAVNAACDALDGVKDGILNDPTRCHFNPDSMVCKQAESDRCLTAAQATSLKKLYAGPHNSRGELIFPGYEPGGEEGHGGWTLWITGTHPGDSLMFRFGTAYFSNMVYDDPAWDWHTFNADTSVALARKKHGSVLDSNDPELSAFRQRGGKLILYHGWNDAAIAPLNTVNYFKSILATAGNKPAESFVRLYMVPGMQHCGGGPGPDAFGEFGPVGRRGDARHDMSAALEQWVEKGTAPGEIIAVKREVPANPASPPKMTRPLCPYPEVARYNGSGDTNDAASFTCGAEK